MKKQVNENVKKYAIVARTNGWIAQRDTLFGGKCEVVIADEMTLKEAHARLLGMFCEDFGYCENWGLAVIKTRGSIDGASKTRADGTRRYEYDSRVYEIVEQ